VCTLKKRNNSFQKELTISLSISSYFLVILQDMNHREDNIGLGLGPQSAAITVGINSARNIGGRYIENVSKKLPADQPIAFPEFKGLQVNMMPIDADDLVNTVPQELHGYLPIVEACLSHQMGGTFKQRAENPFTFHGPIDTGVCYLSVWESQVPKLEAQRRPGLHTEATRTLEPVYGCASVVYSKPLPGCVPGNGVGHKCVGHEGGDEYSVTRRAAGDVARYEKESGPEVWQLSLNDPDSDSDKYPHPPNCVCCGVLNWGGGEIRKLGQYEQDTDRTCLY